MPTVSTGRLPSSPGADVAWHAWDPDGPPRATLAVCHGFGEHGRLAPYDALAAALAEAGIAVALFDAGGHGQSAGPRGHVVSARQYDATVTWFRAFAAARGGGRPLFLLGMSAGSLPSLRSAIEAPAGLAGLILVASPLGRVGASPLVMGVASLAARIAPGLGFNPRLDLDNLSRDREMTRAIHDDPLFHQRATAGAVRYFLAEAAALRADAGRLAVPLLMLHGADDRIAMPHTEAFERAGVADKTRCLYPGARHNLFAETNRAEVFADIAAWIGARAAAGTLPPS
ncbi:MAG: alpha/beta fold hydrolase [Vicinamibacterales bacterium]